MPIMLKRKNGEIKPLKHSPYLPAYYFIPKELLDRCPESLRKIPRCLGSSYATKKLKTYIIISWSIPYPFAREGKPKFLEASLIHRSFLAVPLPLGGRLNSRKQPNQRTALR